MTPFLGVETIPHSHTCNSATRGPPHVANMRLPCIYVGYDAPPPQEILSDVNRRRVGKASLGVQAAHYFGAGALLCRSQTLSLHL